MASGNTLLTFLPLGSEPTSTNYATLALRNLHPVLEFDQSTSEAASWTGVLPNHYSGLGLTVTVCWTQQAQTTGGVVWSATIERFHASTTDLDIDDFASVIVAAGTVSSTIGAPIYTAIALVNGTAETDSLAAGESFRIKIARVPANGADDLAADAHLLSVTIKET